MLEHNLCECGCGKRVTKLGNKFLAGHNGRGRKRPQEEKDKISKSMKKYLKTPEGHNQRVKTSTGRKHSEETKKKLSKLRMGSGNGMFGKTLSEETKLKISIASKGRKHTKKSIQKMKSKHKGKVISKKQKQQISQTLKKYYETNINPWKDKKHSEESKQKMREANLGKYDEPNHPQWKGEISNFPYCFSWPKISLAIRSRDNFKCQNRRCRKNTNRLTVHHINYNKQNCEADNLITLCISCNSRANFDREFHQKYYQQRLTKLLKKYSKRQPPKKLPIKRSIRECRTSRRPCP